MDLSEFDSMLAGNKPTERRQYETVQPGTYRVEILSEETKPTKANDGAYLELVLRIEDGQFAGQRIWDRLNLKNKNAKAVEIALASLRSIQRACSLDKLTSSSELVGHKLRIKTRVREWNGRESAEVVEYLPYHAEPRVVNPQPGKEFNNDDYPF
jgi:hypothetical protein